MQDLEPVKKFQCGDRVKFTEKFLEDNANYIDPAITEEDMQGTVKFYSAEGLLVVAFDDGTTNVYGPEAFELIK